MKRKPEKPGRKHEAVKGQITLHVVFRGQDYQDFVKLRDLLERRAEDVKIPNTEVLRCGIRAALKKYGDS